MRGPGIQNKPLLYGGFESILRCVRPSLRNKQTNNQKEKNTNRTLSALKRDSKSVWPSRSIQGGFSLSYARPPQPRSPRSFEHKALAVRASPPLFSSISLHFKHDPAVPSLPATITMLSLTTRSRHLAHSCRCSTVSARSLSIDLAPATK